MKFIVGIFAIFVFLSASGQSNYITKDTTILGWNAKITYRQGFADSTNIFIHINGLQEVGTDTTKAKTYGPHYQLTHGWDGGIVLGNGTHYPVYVTLQPPAAYPQPQTIKPKVDALISRFKVRDGGVGVSGLSMGGWAWLSYIYYEPTLHDHTYANQIRVFISMASMKADDNFGADPYSWPNYFGHAALNSNIRAVAFEQVLDGRGQDTEWKRMMDSTGNTTRFPFFWTNFGNSGHTGFNEMESYTQTNWTLTNPDVQNSNGGAINTNPIATGQNIWTWAFRQFKDTSLPSGGNILPDVNAGSDSTILFVTDTIAITGTGSDPDGTIVTKTWSQTSGPNTATITTPSAFSTTITGMVYGTYVFRLTVVDNDGESSFDERTVYNGIPCNQAAGQRYTISTTSPGEIYITSGYTRGWKGGDTLDIPAGTYSLIEIDTFGGDPCRPIYIRNVGGQVVSDIIRFKRDVHYVEFIGNGTPGTMYGFKARTVGNTKTAWFTFRRVEIGPNPSGVGIFWKQDNQDFTDSLNSFNKTYAYVNRKIWIDSCYIHNIGGEGMYIGHTGPDGNEETNYIVPQRGDSTTISNCIVDSTDWDGIQLSNARNGCLIYNNTVTNFGLIDMGSQRAGIISGGNTSSKIYNNYVANGTGNGIEVFGYGNIEVHDNTIANVGTTADNPNGEESFFSNAYLNLVESNPNQDLNLYNNYFVNAQPRGAIRCNNDGSKLGTVILTSNRFCFPGSMPSDWKVNYFIIANSYTDTDNTLYCVPVLGPSTGIRYRIKVNQQ